MDVIQGVAIWNANLNHNLALFVCTSLSGAVDCQDYTASIHDGGV